MMTALMQKTPRKKKTVETNSTPSAVNTKNTKEKESGTSNMTNIVNTDNGECETDRDLNKGKDDENNLTVHNMINTNDIESGETDASPNRTEPVTRENEITTTTTNNIEMVYDWPVLLNSSQLDVNVGTLSQVVQAEIELCTPEKTRKIHGNKLRREPWLTAQLKHSIDKSKKLYRSSLRKNCTPNELTKYANYKKTLRSAIRTAKRLYHTNKCEEYRNNSRMLWQVINEVIGKTRDKSSYVWWHKRQPLHFFLGGCPVWPPIL